MLHHSLARVLLLLLALGCVGSHRATGQEVINRDPTCPGCRIELQPVVSLGSTDGDGAMPTFAASARVDSAGRYIVLLIDESEPFVFDADGSFIRRIGGPGDGPGEFRSVTALDVTKDRLTFVDRDAARLSAFGMNFDLIETTPLPGGSVDQVLYIDAGRLVVNLASSDRASIGYAVYFFGDDLKPYAVRDRYPQVFDDIRGHMRHLMRDQEGGVWTVARYGPLRIRKYSADGEVLGDWADDEGSELLPFSSGDPTDDRPPTPQVLGAWVENGLVWVLSVVADKRWKEGLRKVEGSVRSFYVPSKPMLLFDSVVEVFDPATGTIVAAEHSDGGQPELALGGGLVARLSIDELGWTYVHVLRARLVGAFYQGSEK